MEVGPSDSNDDFAENCIFCLIANDKDKDTTIIKKAGLKLKENSTTVRNKRIQWIPESLFGLSNNKELVCFRDIYPAAPHHYLVIPRQHIVSCFSLHSKHVDLVEKMADMGKAVLRDDAGITNMKDIRLGFHRPPYTSVDHLHLHVLAPASQISDFMVHKFIPGTERFINEDHLRRLLKKAASKTSISGIDDCLFCEIANNQTETEILLSDNELVCFRDSKPGTTHHYLVVPRTHIGNCKTLQKEHIPLVEQMEKMGRSVLKKNKVSDLDDIRMGFHLPPFSSVPHLHLHVLAPASRMSSRSLTRYGPQSYWFITVDKVLHQLRTHSKVK